MREYILKGSNRVFRGGSWNNTAGNCAVANRNNDTPSNRNTNYGFRLVLQLSALSFGEKFQKWE